VRARWHIAAAKYRSVREISLPVGFAYWPHIIYTA
jgi:hypothetical protein